MKKLIFPALILLLLLAPAAAKACEPCPEVLPLEETAAQADLIVIGHQVGQDPAWDGSTIDGPDWIEVQITETWKGTPPDSVITVNSWNGMCAYGVVFQEGVDTYFLLLKKISSGDPPPQYDAVNYGCSFYQLPVADGMVTYQEAQIPLDEFAAQLGLERNTFIEDKPIEPTAAQDNTPVPAEEEEPLTGLWVPCGGVLLPLGLVGFFILRRKPPPHRN